MVTGKAGEPVDGDIAVCGDKAKPAALEEQPSGAHFVSIWVMLLARIFEINPLVCPGCGGEMRIIAFITEMEPVGRILRHIGEPDSAPEISPARGPPNLELVLDQSQELDVDAVDPGPEFSYDQTINW